MNPVDVCNCVEVRYGPVNLIRTVLKNPFETELGIVHSRLDRILVLIIGNQFVEEYDYVIKQAHRYFVSDCLIGSVSGICSYSLRDIGKSADVEWRSFLFLIVDIGNQIHVCKSHIHRLAEHRNDIVGCKRDGNIISLNLGDESLSCEWIAEEHRQSSKDRGAYDRTVQYFPEIPICHVILRMVGLTGFRVFHGKGFSHCLIRSTGFCCLQNRFHYRGGELLKFFFSVDFTGQENRHISLPVIVVIRRIPLKTCLVFLYKTVEEFYGLIDHAFSGSSQSGLSEFFHVPAAFLKCLRTASCKECNKENQSENNNHSVSSHSVLSLCDDNITKTSFLMGKRFIKSRNHAL